MKAILRWIRNFSGPVRITEGAIVPRWMAVAYFDYVRHEAVLYAVPLHHLVALVWKINLVWCRYRQRESWIEREVNKAVKKERDLAAVQKIADQRFRHEVFLLIAAILMKHGGSLTIRRGDLMRVPPNYSIEQTEDKVFGAIRLNLRIRP